MNIFLTELHPARHAASMCDSHIVKMILEYAQMIRMAELLNPELTSSWVKQNAIGFRKQHLKHPCTEWVAEKYMHYYRMHELLDEVCREYTYRFGKVHPYQRLHQEHNVYSNLHSSERMYTKWQELDSAPNSFKNYCFIVRDYTEPLCVTSVNSYRCYYLVDKGERGMLRYTHRTPPVWMLAQDSKHISVTTAGPLTWVQHSGMIGASLLRSFKDGSNPALIRTIADCYH